MDASHARLAKTRGEYEGQHGLLRASRGLLNILDWQNRSVSPPAVCRAAWRGRHPLLAPQLSLWPR